MQEETISNRQLHLLDTIENAALKYSSAAPVTVTYTSKTLVLYRVVNPLVVEPALFHILTTKNAVLLRNNQAADCPLSRTLAPLTRLFFQPKPPWEVMSDLIRHRQEVVHLNCCFRLSAPHGSLSFRGSQQFVGFSSTPFQEYRTTSLEKSLYFSRTYPLLAPGGMGLGQ